MHHTPLIAMIAAGFAAALLLGMLASRLRLSPIVGYLAAGVLVGPYTPGFVGDAEVAAQLAEIGVILLMFGVGTVRPNAPAGKDGLLARENGSQTQAR